MKKKIERILNGKRGMPIFLLIFLCTISLVLNIFVYFYMIQVIPQFLKVPVTLPMDDNEDNGWWNWKQSYSIYGDFFSRFYIYRTEAYLNYANISKETGFKNIAYQFNNELSKRGWVSTDYYTSCGYLLPENDFINQSESISLDYLKEGYEPPFGAGGASTDFLCLRVWSNSSDGYHIVYLNVRPAPLTKFINSLD